MLQHGEHGRHLSVAVDPHGAEVGGVVLDLHGDLGGLPEGPGGVDEVALDESAEATGDIMPCTKSITGWRPVAPPGACAMAWQRM